MTDPDRDTPQTQTPAVHQSGRSTEAPTTSPPPAMIAQLYDELREIARRQMSRERPDHTLQTTALVHEAYLRLGANWPAAGDGSGSTGTRNFFNAAAVAMRRILVDQARARDRLKRGGGQGHVPLDAAEPADDAITASVSADESTDWLALDDALVALEAQDKELAELVSLRYFAGLSVDQTAAALGVSASTVDRDWRLARAFLQRRLIGASARPPSPAG